jgi:glycerophosphoryl diester phosphodiesterase
METRFAMKKNAPLVIAHRGFSSRFTENTLPAVRAALELGVDYVEIDVHETSDGEVVVFHDYRLNRLCGVRGRVRDTTLARFKRLNPDIPTLAEVLRHCRGKARVLIEIKRATPRKVAGVIEALGMEKEVIVFSLSIRTMKLLAEANPRIPRFGLIARNLRWAMARWRFSARVQGLGLSRRLVNSHAVVDRVHRRGWRLFVWTVNRAPQMRQLASWGVDGLITNHPDRAKSCLAPR